MAVTTPPLPLSRAGFVIDRQIDDASDFDALPNDVIVHQKDTGEVFKKNASGNKEKTFNPSTGNKLFLYNNFT